MHGQISKGEGWNQTFSAHMFLCVMVMPPDGSVPHALCLRQREVNDCVLCNHTQHDAISKQIGDVHLCSFWSSVHLNSECQYISIRIAHGTLDVRDTVHECIWL